MDNLTKAKRSWAMSRVGARDTVPEIKVRRAAHSVGLRFRLHRKDLPGKPDLVFPRLHAVVFVHGCFWHRHEGCPASKMPKSNTRYWKRKFLRNVTRDKEVEGALRSKGWRVVVIWECETRDEETLRKTLRGQLEESSQFA